MPGPVGRRGAWREEVFLLSRSQPCCALSSAECEGTYLGGRASALPLLNARKPLPIGTSSSC